MPDTDTNTNTKSLQWSESQPIAGDATSRSAKFDGGRRQMTEITDVDGNKRVYCDHSPLNPNLKADNVIAATQAFHEDVCPAIEKRRNALGPDPRFSGQASRQAIDAWTAAKDTLTVFDQFTYDYAAIYRTRANGSFMPKEEAVRRDRNWRLWATGSVDKQDTTADDQTPVPTTSGSVPDQE